MTKTLEQRVEEYAAGLRGYLNGGGEAALRHAYELGRGALADGMGVLDMAALHHQAVRAVLGDGAGEAGSNTIEAAEVFFAESLAVFEMTHRGFEEANAALRRMNERLEDEAKRIAHVLHDEAVQLLASVHFALDDLARAVPPSRDRVQHVCGLLAQIEEQLRRLSHELRPTMLDDLGLVPALNFLAQGIAKRSGLAIAVEGSTDGRLTAAVETGLYRIAQEALTNVTRHARANRARVHIEREGRSVRCSIEDDGVGFDMAEVFVRSGERGFGLAAIRERIDSLGGTLRITSAPGQGTTIVVTVDTEG